MAEDARRSGRKAAALANENGLKKAEVMPRCCGEDWPKASRKLSALKGGTEASAAWLDVVEW